MTQDTEGLRQKAREWVIEHKTSDGTGLHDSWFTIHAQTAIEWMAEFAASVEAGRREAQAGCINCGEKNDGGYMTGFEGHVDEGAVGPFCSLCWELVREFFQAESALNAAQEQAAKDWAADDRLWTTQETVEINLRTFARVILKEAGVEAGRREAQAQTEATVNQVLAYLHKYQHKLPNDAEFPNLWEALHRLIGCEECLAKAAPATPEEP